MQPTRIPPAAFEIGSFAQAPKFPALEFLSGADFFAFLHDGQSVLDARYAYELTLATPEPRLLRPGTCGPCLRPTEFTTATGSGDAPALPNFREGMLCDCPDRLNNRQRALLHFVQAAGVLPWTRLLRLGPAAAVDARLAAMVAQFMPVPRAVAALGLAAFHMAVSHDHLHELPARDAALAGLAAALVEGGRFIFTVPFHQARERSEERGGRCEFGWDILDRLRSAGFRDAAAYLYWSEELGYLGPMNFVFQAIR
jgi:SAM-dependent methyltransferase